MIIGLDIDGVVLDSEKYWLVLSAIYDVEHKITGKKIPEESTLFERCATWPKVLEDDFWDKVIDTEEYGIKPGAKIVLDKLREEGHEFVVVTARGSEEEGIHSSPNLVEIAKRKLAEGG